MSFDLETATARGLLSLLAIKGIGPVAATKLARRFSNARQIIDAERDDLAGLASASAAAALREKSTWVAALEHADRILDRAEQLNVRVLSIFDSDYPEWMRSIADAPAVVYLRGTLRPGLRYVACIGTREPSKFGVEVTKRITSFAARSQWSVVSGLALGVDTLAHRAALDCGAHTVAVLANGLDSVYPRSNSDMAEEIVTKGGALISEQPFGVPPAGRNLVQRDRLQSGMSAGTIVMQTDIIGGSMHTVRFTLLQHRLLFAPVPVGSHAEEPKSRGILALVMRTGSELAKILEASGEYERLLKEEFTGRPPASGLRGKDDYERLFTTLEASVSGKQQSEQRQRQLGLF